MIRAAVRLWMGKWVWITVQISVILIKEQSTRVWRSSTMKQLSKHFQQRYTCWMADIHNFKDGNVESEVPWLILEESVRKWKSAKRAPVFWFSWQLPAILRPVGSQDWDLSGRNWGPHLGFRVSLCTALSPATLPSSHSCGTGLPAFSLRPKAKLVRSPLMVWISGNRAIESRKDTTWANKLFAFQHEFPRSKHNPSVQKDRLPGK